MYSLLQKAAEKRWVIFVCTAENLDENGFAVVGELVVSFPADD
jgi:hypothetical protein